MSKGNKSVSTPNVIAKLRQIEALVKTCIEEVEGQPQSKSNKRPTASLGASSEKLNFDTNVRNFVRTHGARLSGSKKFVLLVAYLAKGQPGKELKLKDIEHKWSKMTALLGGKFNRKYSNDAKERGWVDTKRQGFYVLGPTWREIFSGA